MTSVGLRELRQRATDLLRLVEAGETIEITDRGRPVATLAPIPRTTQAAEPMTPVQPMTQAAEPMAPVQPSTPVEQIARTAAADVAPVSADDLTPRSAAPLDLARPAPVPHSLPTAAELRVSARRAGAWIRQSGTKLRRPRLPS